MLRVHIAELSLRRHNNEIKGLTLVCSLGSAAFFFCSVLPAFSQPQGAQASQRVELLTLPDVQTLALHGNRAVQKALVEVGKAEANLQAVKKTRYPSILGFAFAGQQVTGSLPQNLAILPGVFEPVTQQYRLSLQVKQATLLVQIAKQELRLAKQNAVADVKKTYLRLVAQQSAIRARQKNLEYLHTLVSFVDAEVKRGSALRVDLMSAQAREATGEYELARERNTFVTELQTLNQLLNRPLKDQIEVRADALPVVSIDEQASSYAVASRPELSRIKLNANRSRLEQKVVLSRYIPDVSFGTTAVFSRYLEPPLPRTFMSVGFLGVWEPWDWGRKIDQAKVAARDNQQSLIELSDFIDKVSVEADNARRVLKVVEIEVRAAQLTMNSAEEQLRITDKRYKAGAAVLKDVTDAQSTYSEAINKDIKAKIDYTSAQVDLDKAIGKDYD